MDSSEIETLHHLAEEIAREAGEIQLAGRSSARQNYAQKTSSNDIVTITDKEAEAHIVERVEGPARRGIDLGDGLEGDRGHEAGNSTGGPHAGGALAAKPSTASRSCTP